ncbi:MAG: tRNA (adenosine(37)-N6)-threonylcarbamoyltransferase complex ATPase subunit type 1 TsaE [Fidelibacterota bacterium]
MSKIKVNLNNVNTTHTFAQKLASLLPAGTVIAMTGELGSGKTTFTQGFAKGLGVQDIVGSPTFKLISEYEGAELKLYHIDCYRLENESEFMKIGGENYLDPTEGITVIEWSENIVNILPDNCVKLHFQRLKDNDDKRELTIEGLGF